MLTHPPPVESARLTWESLTASQQRQLTSQLAQLLQQYLAAHRAASQQTATRQLTIKERPHEQPTP